MVIPDGRMSYMRALLVAARMRMRYMRDPHDARMSYMRAPQR